MNQPIALKEWDAVCQAMAAGRQTITLRKGGIHERGGVFRTDYDSFMLYPTLEHQSAEAIQPEEAGFLNSSVSPDRVVLSLYAQCLSVQTLTTEAQARALAPFTIWTADYLSKRFLLYPDRPLWLLTLRIRRIEPPIDLPDHPSYAGCHSWVPLKGATAASERIGAPVLDDEKFAAHVDFLQKKVLE